MCEVETFKKRPLMLKWDQDLKYNAIIAPAFYITLGHICGPFKAYSMDHKRTTIKVWLIAYYCMSASTASVKVMDDCSTQSFIQSFIKLFCDFGYQKFMPVNKGVSL